MQLRLSPSLQKRVASIRSTVELRDIVLFMLPVVLLTIVLFALWPGLYTSDSYDQYNQAQTGIVYPAHPVFHTFTIWLVNSIHHSRVMLPLAHIFLFSLMWAVMCGYIRRLYNKSDKVFYAQFVFMVILCILPIIYTYSVSAWKDVLYSYSLLSLAFLLFIGSYKKFNYSTLEIVCIALLLSLAVAYRHNGVIPALVVFVILSVGMIKYKTSTRKIVTLTGLSVVFYALTIFVPHLFLEVRATSEINSKTGVSIFYMAGLMNSGINIDEQDQRILYSIMPKQYWISDYNQYSYVPIAFNEHFNHEAAEKYTDQIFDMVIKYSLQNPSRSAERFFAVNNMAWNVYWSTTGPYKTTPFINAMPLSEKSLEDNAKTSKLEFLNDEIRLNVAYTLNSSIAQTLLYRPALYMYLSIAVVVAMVIKTKKRRYWLLLIPMLSNIPAILVFGLTQDMRYLYINVLTFFLVLLVSISYVYSVQKKANSMV